MSSSKMGNINSIAHDDPRASEQISSLLSQGGKYIGRIGGVEFESVALAKTRSEVLRYSMRGAMAKTPLYRGLEAGFIPFDSYQIFRASQMAGFFCDELFSLRAEWKNFIEVQDTAYKEADQLMYAGLDAQLLLEKGIDRSFSYYLKTRLGEKALIDFRFVSLLRDFLSSMKFWADGKKILVVSAFPKTVQKQFDNRHELYKLRNIADFEIQIASSPMTLSDYGVTFGRHKHPYARTDRWSAELAMLKEKVLEMDFDVALLSCASYSNPLGTAIAKSGRSAIYLGGALNPLFNIFGARFDWKNYDEILREDSRITVDESERYPLLRSGRRYQSEALRAYL